MRRRIRRLIPQMFHRRLLLLAVAGGVVMALLAVQTANLTIVQGAALGAEAQSALVRHRLITTIRGRIIDRYGRVLAQDDAGYNIAVSYSVITGLWAADYARRQARRRYRLRWRELDDAQKQAIVEQLLPSYDQQVNRMWRTLARLTGTDPLQLQQRQAKIIRSVHRMSRSHWANLIQRRNKTSDQIVTLADVSDEQIREQTSSHVLFENISDPVRFEVGRLINAATTQAASTSDFDSVWDHVVVQLRTKRDYPWRQVSVMVDRSTLPAPLRQNDTIEVEVSKVARLIIGTLRQRMYPNELQAHPYRKRITPGKYVYDLHGYRDGDAIGSRGVELLREKQLRGWRGRLATYRDGRAATRIDPIPGGDVELTLDIQLQARIGAIMSSDSGLGLMRAHKWHKKPKDRPYVPRENEPLNGAAVVLDVSSGAILAAVSAPWKLPARLQEDQLAAKHWQQRNMSWLNRTLARTYPPGSTVKPLVLAALYSDGKLGYDEKLACAPGYYYPNQKDRARCWIFKNFNRTHGKLTGPEAIMRSCNMFFYRGGERLGTDHLWQWYELFAMDRPKTGQSFATAAQMAIGQGPVEWTVVQAAAAYGALARGGVYVKPTYFKDQLSSSLHRSINLHLDRRGLELVLEGLKLSANDPHGTTSRLHLDRGQTDSIFNIGNIDFYAKSGTAAASDQIVNGKIIRQGDHGWTICLAKRPDSPQPDYVIAVVVEYGGSGGHTAGPIVNQILFALRHEGYL